MLCNSKTRLCQCQRGWAGPLQQPALPSRWLQPVKPWPLAWEASPACRPCATSPCVLLLQCCWTTLFRWAAVHHVSFYAAVAVALNCALQVGCCAHHVSLCAAVAVLPSYVLQKGCCVSCLSVHCCSSAAELCCSGGDKFSLCAAVAVLLDYTLQVETHRWPVWQAKSGKPWPILRAHGFSGLLQPLSGCLHSAALFSS